MKITITVNRQPFQMDLADNKTAAAFAGLLPLELDMQDVNGNEKFYLLTDSLPQDPRPCRQITAGSLLLYQTNELTFFYDETASSFKFSEIGSVNDIKGFSQAMSGRAVTVSFEENDK
ncbi:hypothetical protein DDV21_004960 [Streptococcus chenjunshii]|uniref:Cyclophilin-like domain-containing protein n=1 Tax=Streptococcus chenjunshii TaxID=2173853 RepID=A0A372KPS7_9STRE|nr:cyclophilin-like fold protein [Streptococcus chenjunshii]AXQ78472.1 hypothetical protein DDV21_004960 [Streptococcus chenjunshii]RFU52067.1 hypothetical protein DDV22_01085 [Streptococcus chenjunshii]RFU54259.1 hypothetical protein DDV23_01640 [Streptococcus chenjunshii]